MTLAPTVPAESMRDKLIDLNDLYSRLSAAEPIKACYFSVGDAIRFTVDPTWNHGAAAQSPADPIGVYATLGTGQFKNDFRLTRQTLNDVARMVGLPVAYVADCPAELLAPHLNYWYREGLFAKKGKGRDFQFILNADNTAVAFAKAAMTPFSNIKLLDTAVGQITGRFGDVEVLADYKLHHSLRGTHLRLIIPYASRAMTDTGTDDDVWSMGVQIKNSLTGATQTSIEGYLFRWVCTNGQIDTRAASGPYTRRKDATQDEVYAWAKLSVDEVLGGLEGALDAVQGLTGLGIDGSLSDTLRDIFEHYRIPIAHRPRIIRFLETYDGEITMYVIMNAITQVANDMSLDPGQIDALLRVGGDLPYTASDRCGACHRLRHSH